ncbi:6100_t:CDS:1, partial [Gigaspora margarita]
KQSKKAKMSHINNEENDLYNDAQNFSNNITAKSSKTSSILSICIITLADNNKTNRQTQIEIKAELCLEPQNEADQSAKAERLDKYEQC